MQQTYTKCFKLKDNKNKCIYCNNTCVKNGVSKANQRYKCKTCNKSFQQQYIYNAYHSNINENITSLLKEGCGIRSISRLLHISTTTVLARLISIGNNIAKPAIILNKEYEVDEMCTYIQKKTKQIWIVYALQKGTKNTIDFAIGDRTSKTLNKVVSSLLYANASKIYTDKLNSYRSLIPKERHSTKFRSTNHIERNNLSIRTHLKRLSRRTICFSKNMVMLFACLKIYFWS